MRLLGLALLLALSLPLWAVMPAPAAEGLSAFAGRWTGESASLAMVLDIQPDGRFRWSAERGNARAEGEGRIEPAPSGYRLGLPFLRPGALRIERNPSAPGLVLRDEGDQAAWPLRPVR
jgi:hypothetical protein